MHLLIVSEPKNGVLKILKQPGPIIRIARMYNFDHWPGLKKIYLLGSHFKQNTCFSKFSPVSGVN